MKNVFLINTSLDKSSLKERIEKISEDAVVISTHSVSDFILKAQYYSSVDEVETIYAVGGDGTVNLLATILINTKKKLGVIPLGQNNRIYHSILKTPVIDVGYINEHLFLNHAIIDIDFTNSGNSNKYNYQELNNFEFATNVRGKYEILSANMFGITNDSIGNKYALDDGKMEICLVENKKRIFGKQGEHKFKNMISTSRFDVDCLGTLPMIIDGDIYPINKFHFKVSPNKLLVSSGDFVKKLGLFKTR